ncbi:MAG: succinate dehydrogenase/fumarate reductase iron-sulfur subunit [Nitrospirae bacterium]|nr:succinate dehydrogenase/fumarate reductase iron-sulfur subunit [Candidatus Manganitrophaceae bacterium]
MRVKLTVQKFNPDIDLKPHPQDYFVETSRGMTLLSALLKIKAETDGTLTFRASCRAAICGSCLMQVNGSQKLACKVAIKEELEHHGKIEVGPMANMPVIKDMVVRMDPFWEKIRAVTPYLLEDGGKPVPTEALKDIHKKLDNADACIMCMACLSACTSYEVSPGFLGPAALAKAYRFQADPRDQGHVDRLEKLQGPNGIWDCVRCNFCVQVCPKDVQPMEQIIRLRRRSIGAGFTDSVEAKHITEFTKVVAAEGRLNEALLPVLMTLGNIRKMIRIIPLGIKMFLHGKTPFPFKRVPGRQEIRAIFKKWEKPK